MTDFHYALIKADGHEETIHSTEPLDYTTLQRYVGGFIEFVSCPRVADAEQYDLCVNEEGTFYGLPRNEHASLIAGRRIVGDVVLATRETFTAESTPTEGVQTDE